MTKKAFDKIAAGLESAIDIVEGRADPDTYRIHEPRRVIAPMTDEELAELEKLVIAGKPGPFKWNSNASQLVANDGRTTLFRDARWWNGRQEDQDAIIAILNGIPALIARLEAAEVEREIQKRSADENALEVNSLQSALSSSRAEVDKYKELFDGNHSVELHANILRHGALSKYHGLHIAGATDYDSICETAAIADECAFWRYQAIWGRTYMLDRHTVNFPMMEESAAWKEATKQLEDARTEENRERIAGIDYPKVPLS